MGDLRKRGDEAKSQIEERYRKAQADKEYANRVIEERKQQAKENAARRNAEIEEQRRKIAERKAAEEEARKTKTLDRRVMGDSDVILRNALMPYGDWNRATADALADFDLERFTTKEQRDAFLGARGPGGPGRFISGAGIDLTGMSSALSALTKMRIGTVGGLGLSILAGAIAQVIVDIINGRSAEEIVKNFFKYPVDWAADTIQFIAELSQQIYDWGVETWGDEASQLRNRINRLEGELGSGFLGVYDPSEAREMASLLAQELRLNEIKEPKELQAFIRALDNSINDYRGFGSTSLALSRLMRDLKQMIKEETKGRKRVLIAVYQEGLNRINHIEALRREFGSAIRHSGVSSNGGAQVARLADANSRLEIPGTFRMQDWWEAEAFRNYGPS
eukprot:tig00000551_g2050.t1